MTDVSDTLPRGMVGWVSICPVPKTVLHSKFGHPLLWSAVYFQQHCQHWLYSEYANVQRTILMA